MASEPQKPISRNFNFCVISFCLQNNKKNRLGGRFFETIPSLFYFLFRIEAKIGYLVSSSRKGTALICIDAFNRHCS